MSALGLLIAVLAAPTELVETRVEVPRSGTRLALRDMDGDGANDLVLIDRDGFRVRFLGADGRFGDPTPALEWPGADLGWDLADVDGDGANELVALVDARRVRAWRASREGFDGGRDVLERVDGHLPHGRRHVRFVRDVDGDGRSDIVIPSSGRYLIHLAAEDGWSRPLQVTFEATIGHDVGDPRRIDEVFGTSIRIPWFSLRDLDGDGRTDLLSETEDVAQFHIASPGLPAEPTWTLDKSALKRDPGSFELDFDDLFAVFQGRVAWRIADLDGEAPSDLIVQQGSTFRVYRGGSRTGISGTPDDLLKSSGHVLTFLLDDLDGDGRPELLMVRAEKISLGRVVRWLVLPGSLDFDVFAYRNEGGVFGKKPMSRVAISLEIPRLFSFFEELEEAADDVGASLALPTTLGVLDPDGEPDDVVDLVGSEIVFYRDCAPADVGLDWRSLDEIDIGDMIHSFLREQIDGLDDGDVATIDLGELGKLDISPADELRSACRGRTPVLRHALALEDDETALDVVDIDGDGISDVVVYQSDVEREVRVVQFLVTR